MRFEYKYFVPADFLPMLRNMVCPFLGVDKNAAKAGGQYTVRSIYYETPDFEMYHTKQDGVAHRLKVRLRGYDVITDESTIFFEIKRKYEGPILKNRCQTNYGIAKKIIAGGDPDALLEGNKRIDDGKRFMYQVFSRRMIPLVNVIYEREPYHGLFLDPENDFRLTIDKNLRGVAYPKISELGSETNAKYANSGFAILEIKFNKYMPAWLKPVVAEGRLNKEPASKYVMCIDACKDINCNRMSEPLIKGR